MSGEPKSQAQEGNYIPVLPPAAFNVSEEEYDELSIIEVTPRHSGNNLDGKFRTLTTAGSALDAENETPSIIRASSASSSLALSVASHHERGKGLRREEPNQPLSVGSFLSSLTRGWSKGVETKRAGEPGSESPSSVVERITPRRKVSKCRKPSVEQKELLKKPIFASIDGPDAVEFQDFLEEDGGSSSRIPVLCLADYGRRGAYATDIFVLMHNTIRRELFDMFEIIKVIRHEYLSLTWEDIYQVRKFWRFIVILWREYVGYERTLLNPMVQQICLVDGRSDVLLKKLAPIRDTREWMDLKMLEITSYVEEYEKLPTGRALILFCRTVDSFADKARYYFAGQERILPPFIENYHGEEVKLSVECQLMERLRKSPYFPELVVSMVRWMGSVQGFSSPRSQSRDREKWLSTHLFWMERQNLSRYYRKYEASHGKVLSHFRNRLQASDSL